MTGRACNAIRISSILHYFPDRGIDICIIVLTEGSLTVAALVLFERFVTISVQYRTGQLYICA